MKIDVMSQNIHLCPFHLLAAIARIRYGIDSKICKEFVKRVIDNILLI